MYSATDAALRDPQNPSTACPLNAVLRPLAYRLHPVLPEATPLETTYQVRLACSLSSSARVLALLLSTISRLPVTLQPIHEDQNDDDNQAHIRVEMMTVGRNNEAIEQVVIRLSMVDDVSTLSWSIAIGSSWMGPAGRSNHLQK
jgi:putative Mg2+ transporter-C (MgtC) family protein